MQDADWGHENAHALGVFLNGEEIPNHDHDGNPLLGDSFLLLFNAHQEPHCRSQCQPNWARRGPR